VIRKAALIHDTINAATIPALQLSDGQQHLA
jgi:hypothetical protein